MEARKNAKLAKDLKDNQQDNPGTQSREEERKNSDNTTETSKKEDDGFTQFTRKWNKKSANKKGNANTANFNNKKEEVVQTKALVINEPQFPAKTTSINEPQMFTKTNSLIETQLPAETSFNAEPQPEGLQ